ncbi:hypothetical protein ABZP36_026060 [Zizania latifolia]
MAPTFSSVPLCALRTAPRRPPTLCMAPTFSSVPLCALRTAPRRPPTLCTASGLGGRYWVEFRCPVRPPLGLAKCYFGFIRDEELATEVAWVVVYLSALSERAISLIVLHGLGNLVAGDGYMVDSVLIVGNIITGGFGFAEAIWRGFSQARRSVYNV